jgi:hypothetical protein
MRKHPSLLVFSLVFGVVYTICFENVWALFRFYPAYNRFSLTALGPEAGPAILWYGWLANACIVSAAIALVVPRALAAKVSPTLVWGVGVAVLVVIAFLLRTWFI